MSIFSKIFRKKPEFSIDIVYSDYGNFSININPQIGKAYHIDIIESFCHYYFRTLYAIGDSPICEYILGAFSPHINREFSSIDINTVLDDLNIILKLGFDIKNHLRIADISIYSNKYYEGNSSHRLDFYRRKDGTNEVLIHYGVWLSKVTIPLSIFAFYFYVYHKLLKDNKFLTNVFLIFMESLLEQDELSSYYKFSSYKKLILFTEEYFYELRTKISSARN